jgi:hypothetical protein
MAVTFGIVSGGTVLSTGCTEEYTHGYSEYRILGVPVWWRKTSPRNAIQPRVSPGECWAFKGSQGYLVLGLSHMIHVTGFTVEHIHKSISVTGDIQSAPRDFVVHVSSRRENSSTRYKTWPIVDVQMRTFCYLLVLVSVDRTRPPDPHSPFAHFEDA